VPWFAPVILKLRDLDDYDDAELVRKKIEACFAAFVTGADTPMEAAGSGRLLLVVLSTDRYSRDRLPRRRRPRRRRRVRLSYPRRQR
jgi:capsid protein